jgi:hypothetical protein
MRVIRCCVRDVEVAGSNPVTPILTQGQRRQQFATDLNGSGNLSKHLSDTLGDTFFAAKRQILFLQLTRSIPDKLNRRGLAGPTCTNHTVQSAAKRDPQAIEKAADDSEVLDALGDGLPNHVRLQKSLKQTWRSNLPWANLRIGQTTVSEPARSAYQTPSMSGITERTGWVPPRIRGMGDVYECVISRSGVKNRFPRIIRSG